MNKTSCSSILNIAACAARDDSIIKKEFLTYTPYSNSLGESEEIRIVIQNQDSCLLPCESYLYMQFIVTTQNNNDAAADKIKFAHNFPSFLFSDARYLLNGVEIDRIRNVGITSTMKLYAASCPSTTEGYYRFNKSLSSKEAQNAKVRTYDVMLPLSSWFGFCDDYRKVILNSRHELILNRARNSLNSICGGSNEANATSVSIAISKLEWKMPHVTLVDSIKMSMNSLVAKNKKLPLQFRSWDMYEFPELPQTKNNIWTVKTTLQLNKPRFVLVAFQCDRNGKKTADSSKFDSLHLNSVRLHLNSNVYPYHMHDVNIIDGQISELYEAYVNIQSSYYYGLEQNNLFTQSLGEFQSNVLFAFDTSRADETLMSGAIDIRLEINAAENLPAKTTAYCLIIYENEFEYAPCERATIRCV